MNTAGFLYGADFHYIDHLAPLCDFLNIPLVVTEKEIEEEIRKYYPTVITYCYPQETVTAEVLKKYDALFTCLPSPMIDNLFFLEEHLFRKKLLTIWVPHGNSDKGREIPFMEALRDEKILLVYGQNMIDFLYIKGVLQKVYRYITVGNFRYEYYKKMEKFYDTLVQKEVLSHFRKKNKVILYAPTWGKEEPYLPIDSLPDHYNLIIKLHPNTLLLHPALCHSLENRSNVFILQDFPPIYPLLRHSDIVVGDFSSINYDFLTFDRPLFFFGEGKGAVRECGPQIVDFSAIDRELPNADSYREKRKALHAHTFTSQEAPISAIYKAIEQYFDEEPHFL